MIQEQLKKLSPYVSLTSTFTSQCKGEDMEKLFSIRCCSVKTLGLRSLVTIDLARSWLGSAQNISVWRNTLLKTIILLSLMHIGVEIPIQHMIDLNQRKIAGKECLLSIQTFNKTIKTNQAVISILFLEALSNLRACLLEEEVCRAIPRKACRIWDQGNCRIPAYKWWMDMIAILNRDMALWVNKCLRPKLWNQENKCLLMAMPKRKISTLWQLKTCHQEVETPNRKIITLISQGFNNNIRMTWGHNTSSPSNQSQAPSSTKAGKKDFLTIKPQIWCHLVIKDL